MAERARGPWFRWEGQALRLELRIQPRASHDETTGVHAGRLRLRLTSPPLEDRANTHLSAWLAREFNVATSRVRLLRGARSRNKTVSIEAPGRLPDWFREQAAAAAAEH